MQIGYTSDTGERQMYVGCRVEEMSYWSILLPISISLICKLSPLYYQWSHSSICKIHPIPDGQKKLWDDFMI